ncbi:MAG: glycosyltransferase [Planctomycetota bacterium]
MGDIITDHDELARRAAELRGDGALVLADGAFDIVHPGHVSFLEAARGAGDALVVALHSDAVVRSNKGPDRPLNAWEDRARVLAALAPVDLVTVQDDRLPDPLIELLRPDLFARGTDFIESNVRERRLVEALGGRILICGEPKSHATEQIVGGEQRFESAWDGAREVDAEPGRITVIVLTRNEEANIRECLESATWADELIVCDSYSTDRTPEIARQYTPNVVQHEYVHYAAQQNWIIPQAATEWVMILDADERISPELAEAARQATASGDEYDGFRVPRQTYFLGRMIRHGGWGRDYTTRLFKRDKGRYMDQEVHADCVVDGRVGRIDAPFIHYTDRDLRNWFEKLDRYSSLSAADLFRRGRRSGWSKLLVKPPAKFLKMYLLKLGFLDGFHGFLLSGLSAVATYARYAKLWEMNRRGATGELPSGRRIQNE